MTVASIKTKRGKSPDKSVRDQYAPQKGDPLTSFPFSRHRNITFGGFVLGRIVCERCTHTMYMGTHVAGRWQSGRDNSTLPGSASRNNYALWFCPYSTGYYPTPPRGGRVPSPPFRGWVNYLYNRKKHLGGGDNV